MEKLTNTQRVFYIVEALDGEIHDIVAARDCAAAYENASNYIKEMSQRLDEAEENYKIRKAVEPEGFYFEVTGVDFTYTLEGFYTNIKPD